VIVFSLMDFSRSWDPSLSALEKREGPFHRPRRNSEKRNIPIMGKALADSSSCDFVLIVDNTTAWFYLSVSSIYTRWECIFCRFSMDKHRQTHQEVRVCRDACILNTGVHTKLIRHICPPSASTLKKLQPQLISTIATWFHQEKVDESNRQREWERDLPHPSS
jgi:hypothetical protein